MKIVIAALDHNTRDVVDRAMAEYEDVDVFHGDIISIECDAYVSPANSLGFMNGGIDMRYTQFYAGSDGRSIEAMVQYMIKKDWNGYMPVGVAQLVTVVDVMKPDLIVAPTMPSPEKVVGTANAYLATAAALACASKWDLDQIAMPVMCSGVGGMPAKAAAFQMMKAIGVHKSHDAVMPEFGTLVEANGFLNQLRHPE